MTCLAIAGVLIISEPLRFALFQGLTPLYTRLNRESIENDIEQENTRGTVYQFIKQNPGANFSLIQKELSLGSGTVV